MHTGQNGICTMRLAGRVFQSRLAWIKILLLLFLLGTFLLLNLGSIRHKTMTTDEPKHYQYGQNILNLDSDRFDDSKMPFSALNALPAELAAVVPIDRLSTFLEKPQTGRLVTMLFSTAVAYFVYRWSQSLYGLVPGLFSIFLYVFDPNIIAHSRLMTTDIYAVGMIYLSVYTFWLFSQHQNWKYATLSAGMLGLSQLAKYTSAYLYLILPLLVVIQNLPALIENLQQKDFAVLRQKLKVVIGWGVFFLLISLLMINIGFLFNRTFTPLCDYTFRSELFQGIQQKLASFGFLPVPVPYPYVEGLDWVKARERTGAGYGRLYLLGELRSGENFKGYYIVATLLKMPIATQMILLLSFFFYIKNWRKDEFFERDIYLLLPAVFFFVYFNFFFRAQIGIRFYLVLFPYLYVFAGSLLQNWRAISREYLILLIVLALGITISVGAHFPHYIPYFNALVWDQRNAYQYLVDSNLDWEQAEWYLDQFMDTHPDAKFEPSRPTLGTIVTSPNRLVGIEGPPDQLLWLREYFRPQETIADVYLIYEVSEDAYNAVRDQIEEE